MASKKAPTKKAPTKKTPAKQTAAKKAPAKKPASKKTAPAGPTFHIFDEKQKKFLPVDAPRPFKPKGFEAYTFFLHKTPGGKGWTVSEASSGARVYTAATMKEVKAKAQEALDKHGEDALARSVAAAIRQHGAAPGFKKPAAKARPEPRKAPVVTQQLRSKILAALVDETKRPRKQVFLEDIVQYTGADTPDVTAALMVLEIEGKVKGLPGRMFRLPVVDEERKSRQDERPKSPASGRAKGKMSMLDAAAEVLKDAKEPTCCKQIVTEILARKLATSEGRTPHATLSAAMGREITKLGKAARFRRVDRGMYELNA